MNGKEQYLTDRTRDILARNEVFIQDRVSISQKITQTTGVLQGDSVSPLLFSIATAAVTRNLEGDAKIHIYADDMVLTFPCCETLQTNLNRLFKWAAENDLKLNDDKTVHGPSREEADLQKRTKLC